MLPALDVLSVHVCSRNKAYKLLIPKVASLIKPVKGDPLSGMISRRPLCRDVESSQIFDAAKKLIDTCLSPKDPKLGHQQCRYSRDKVLPSRVIRVSDQSAQLQINKTHIRGSYLALSYCWGDPDPNKQSNISRLQKDNVERLVQQISLEELEQSVQDAIHVTRQLGFTYLWVDRLCIIQDCKEDKAHKIARMATIYKNAEITLAAGTATQASEGFLGNSQNIAPYLPPHKFVVPLENGSRGIVYLSGKPYEPNHPLDKRGWTLQEYMLSSRMLIFSDYQLLWQCQEIELQSITGNGAGVEYQQHLESLPWAAFDDEGEPSYGTHESEKLYLWKTIIMQYTGRDLRFATDRLNAVTGVITELQKAWRDSHIYGHWERWFIELLAWSIPEKNKLRERNLHRAPSWSWVSVDGRIEFRDAITTKDATAEILTARMVTLRCRVLMYNEIDDSYWPSLTQNFDLVDSVVEEEFQVMQPEYLFLGNTTTNEGDEKGLGLIVLKTDAGTYRRVGLATFGDMSLWDNIKHQTVELEPKQK
ncbi:heterokaryon incompatibility protein-domain-containing protein [Fusarium acuminatum]|uniref:Heterokaryon incompatibility protein-domain-containing protein n=1 Tax=Fusarium acuminatum TaxID=5515 RepID=A0ABZ2WTB4_9HYPO